MSAIHLQPRRLAALAAIVSVAVVCSFLLGADFGPVNPFMGRWSFLILEFAGAIACLWRAWHVQTERPAWSLIGIGLLLWTLGDAYYRAALYTMDTPPVPSPADVLWISFYAFAYAGIGLLIRARAGEMRVTVRSHTTAPVGFRVGRPQPPAVNGPTGAAGGPPPPAVQSIPERYSVPEESGLVVVVGRTTDTFDIPLTR